jgi:hypothetical protein
MAAPESVVSESVKCPNVSRKAIKVDKSSKNGREVVVVSSTIELSMSS